MVVHSLITITVSDPTCIGTYKSFRPCIRSINIICELKIPSLSTGISCRLPVGNSDHSQDLSSSQNWTNTGRRYASKQRKEMMLLYAKPQTLQYNNES